MYGANLCIAVNLDTVTPTSYAMFESYRNSAFHLIRSLEHLVLVGSMVFSSSRQGPCIRGALDDPKSGPKPV